MIIATRYGGPEVLSLVDAPSREPGPGEVVLAVRAAGVNPADYKSYSGAFDTDPTRLPMRLGFEAAGVVTAVGPDATGPAGPIAVGDDVIAYRAAGAYASELVLPAFSIIPKPASLSWAQAAGLMLVGCTAWQALDAIALTEGDAVLIHGASGGVGLLALQLAVARGATVVGTASPGSHDRLRRLGATPVEYGPGLADRVRAAAPTGIDAAIDTVGTDEAIDVSLAFVGDRARIVTAAGFARGAAEGIKMIGSAPGADPGNEVRMAGRLELVKLVNAGLVDVPIGRTFPLAQAADAHRLLMTGHPGGKVALTVD